MKKVFNQVRIGLARLICPSTHEVCERMDDPRKWIKQHYPAYYGAKKGKRRKKLSPPSTLNDPAQSAATDRKPWPETTGVTQEEKASLRREGQP